METREILALPTKEFGQTILALSAEECEKHARNVITKLDGPTYEELLKDIIEGLIPDKDYGEKLESRLYNAVVQHYPNWNESDDMLGRVTMFIFTVIYKRTDNFKDVIRLTKPLH